MHPFYRIWVPAVLILIAHEHGFVAAGCAAVAGVVGYMMAAERQAK